MNKVITFSTKFILNPLLFFFLFNSLAQEIKNESKYHPNAISISEDGLIIGRKAIEVHWMEFHNSKGLFVDYKTVYKIPVLEILDYEIGLSESTKGGQFAHIIIWSKENKATQKMSEVIFERSGTVEIPDELTVARNKWVKLCNEHNSKNLVAELYTEDAIYFNRGRVLRGHEQLSQEYGYMNNPAYSLQLNPKHIEMVTDTMAFEIGQCSGSYPLPYILVWKKQPDGSWKVYFDSNY